MGRRPRIVESGGQSASGEAHAPLSVCGEKLTLNSGPCWSTKIYVKLGGTFPNSRLSEHSFLLCFVVCTAVHLETPIGVRGHPVCARALPARRPATSLNSTHIPEDPKVRFGRTL